MRILLLTGGVIDIDASVSSRDMLVSGLIYWFSKMEEIVNLLDERFKCKKYS